MSLYISSKQARNSSPIKQKHQEAHQCSLEYTEETLKASGLSVPLCVIDRDALPVSINEMDMPAVTDVCIHALVALQHHWLV